jgi:two-component system chemotaxis response regulator CheB
MNTNPTLADPGPAVVACAESRRDTGVIGASAGGPQALIALLGALPRELPAAVFVVQHQHPELPGGLARMLGARAMLPVVLVEGPQRVRPGCVYVAPPDRHLVLHDDVVLVTREPRENRTRPAINPLFRTAAAARGSRTIGILLTGLQDDGVAGLAAIKRCGGLAIVQDPAEAEYAELPRRALAAVAIDHVLGLADLAVKLGELVCQTAPQHAIPADLLAEAKLSLPAGASRAALDAIAEPASIGCPECSGTLWKKGEGETAMYYCRIGHALSPTALLDLQWDEVERSLWVAVRSLEERATTLTNLADDIAARGRRSARERDAAEESAAHARRVREFLTHLGRPASADT